jgi:hypothetical protein
MPPSRRLTLAWQMALAALLVGCVRASSGPAGFCGWIGTDVEGLGRITSEDGTSTVGTWYHVFAEGVTDANAESRREIADAVTADTAGFQHVRDQAPQDVRRALDRLSQLLQDPRTIADRHIDSRVKEDVALIDAQGCDFLRVET